MSKTLSNLRTDIRNYTEVDDNVLSDTVLSTIISNAESRVFRTVDSDDTKFYATSATTTGNRYITVPVGTIIIRYVQLTNPTTSDQVFLEQVDSSFMAEYFKDPDNSDDYAQPKYYAQWDSDNWVVAPTPDQGYNLTMAYIKKPDSITTSDSTTTYLSTYAYDLLLYACLSEAFKYLKGPTNMLDLYERSYQEAVQTFAVEQQGRRRRDEYTSGAIRTLIDAPLPKYK
jgi:hypothetical protein